MFNEEVPPAEAELGLGFFATETPGIGGEIKTHAEDFRVQEDSAPIGEADEAGKYTLARVRAKNWETHRLARVLASQLGIREQDVYFTGTKDKRAVTTQNLAIRASLEKVDQIDLGDVEILDTWRVDRAPKLGEHTGNTFHIRVRNFDLSLEEAEDRAVQIRDELLELGGFPNFFGPQRFGSVRPVTHRVGHELVRGNLEDAVWTYIAYPSEHDPPRIQRERKQIFEDRDPREASKLLPDRFDHEHRMLAHLTDNPKDATGAVETLPLNLARLFVSAYQSHLFNQALVRRARHGHPGRSLQGDLLVPIEEDGHPNKDRFIPVREANEQRCREASDRGWGLPTGFLPGYDPLSARGVQGEIEEAIMEEEELQPDDFQILSLPKLSADGTRRPLWCPLATLEVTAGTDSNGDHVSLSFTLPKGSYATCVLREFMKADLESYS